MKFKRIISSILVLSNVFMGVNFVSANNKWNETNTSNESNSGINLESINSVEKGISELSPSEYLNYIHRIRSCETKEATHESTDSDDLVSTNILYVVMKHEFSEVGFSLTPEYFPELDLVSIENLMDVDENSELINRDNFRNIYKFTFEGKNLESLNEAIETLENRNDVRSVSMVLSSENEMTFESTDAISESQKSSLYNDISADLNITNVPKAWNYCQGSKSVKLGIIDSGIDYTHPDMTDNVWVNEGEIAGDNINLNSLGLISSKVFLDGLTINPSDTGKVEVVPSYKILDGRRYYNYLTD